MEPTTNPLKLRIEKSFSSANELFSAWYKIIAISNNIHLTPFELSLLVEIKLLGGNVNKEIKNLIYKKLDTSMQSVVNSINKLKKYGFITKENSLADGLNPQLTNPTLIFIKYGYTD